MAAIIGTGVILYSIFNMLIWLIHHMSPVGINRGPQQIASKSLKDIALEFFTGVCIVGIFWSGGWLKVVNALISFGNSVASSVNGKVGNM